MAKKRRAAKKAAPRRARRDQGSGGEFTSSPEVRNALIPGNTFGAKAVQYAVIDGLAIFEGDIVLGTPEEVEQRTAELRDNLSGMVTAGVVRSGSQYRWPNCVVPYTIDSSLPNQSRVTDAIQHWEDNTQYNFVLRTSGNASSYPDYITFRPAGGCSSQVGRQGGQQFINLGSGCSTGNTIHEIGHAIGLWHEQSREDRDSFVTINWTKIMSGFEHNFNQHISDGDDVGPYDYGSIMHYPRNAFSVDGSDTITPTDPTASIGQRSALSDGDVAAANSLCPPKSVKEAPLDTTKEVLKDARLDTRKELVLDTRKETVFDTRKEMIKESIKDAAFDPPGGTWRERVTIPGRVTTRPRVTTPVRRVTQPFAVARPHRAPGARDAEAAGGSAVEELDAQLSALAEQMAQMDGEREHLQAQYDEMSALLQQLLDEQDGAE